MSAILVTEAIVIPPDDSICNQDAIDLALEILNSINHLPLDAPEWVRLILIGRRAHHLGAKLDLT